MGRVDVAPNGLVPLRWHPWASEITLIIQGHVQVGFVDTSNRLFSEKLSTGYSFVLVSKRHASFFDSSRPAFVISGLNSQNPGAEIPALAMFTSNPTIVHEVLQKTVLIGEQDLHQIRKNLGRAVEIISDDYFKNGK